MAIYNGTQKINVSGVDKVYVGTQLVWQNTPVLESITLSGQTTSLNRGASFSFGGTVTAHYDNGSTANVTSQTTFSGYNMSVAGTYTVTASYTENGVTKTATYSLTVNKVWSTLWSGSKSLSWNMMYAAPSAVDVYTSSLSGTVDIRVTFSTSSSSLRSDCQVAYISNGSWTTTKPGSPIANSSLNTGANKNIVGIVHRYTSTTSTYEGICLQFQTSGKKFQLIPISSGSIPSGNVTLTVTKIERYY